MNAPDPVTHPLVPLPMWPGVRALEAVPALAKALDGNANVLPVPADDPVRAELLERTQRAGEPIAADVAIVACTSGSTGTPKGAMLTAANLRASIDATHARLGGPGQWLLATPPVHIAGLQVLLRTLRAGEVPVAMELDDGFRPAALAEAIGAMTGRRRYTSVVPLQLRRILEDAEATAALASLDGVLVGGQATAPELLARARAAGITAVTSYGSSETSGGIAYDGVPLDGARVTVETDGDDASGSGAHEGRIVIEGPMVARGYRNVDSPDLRPSLDRAPGGGDGEGEDGGAGGFGGGAGSGGVGGGVGGGAGCGVFRTSDAGRIDDRGDHVVVTVLGRMDDVIISGGLKFLPGPIEDALTSLDGVADAAVVGVPDPELGRAAVAAVTLAPGHAEPNATPSADGTPPENPTDVDATGPTHDRAVSDEFRRRLAPLLGKHQLPRAVFVVKHMPTLPSGKLDRAGLAGTLATRWGMMSE